MSFESPEAQKLSATEKIAKLKEALNPIFEKGFSTVGHGTSIEVANRILEDGLYARGNQLDLTTIPLFSQTEGKTYADQIDGAIDTMLHWPHRGYEAIVIVMIPNPQEDEVGGGRYFNSVFDELPEEKAIRIGVQGADRQYVIPSRFIRGYVNTVTGEFIENKTYDSSAKVSIENGPISLKEGATQRANPTPIPDNQETEKNPPVW